MEKIVKGATKIKVVLLFAERRSVTDSATACGTQVQVHRTYTFRDPRRRIRRRRDLSYPAATTTRFNMDDSLQVPHRGALDDQGGRTRGHTPVHSRVAQKSSHQQLC